MRRSVALIASVLGLSSMMLTVGALTGGGPSEPEVASNSRVAAQPAQILAGVDASASISGLQERLKRLPTDYAAWASLGSLYTAQATSTGDPSYYGKADGAFAMSLKTGPRDNPAALTGKAALAASRHDFGAALTLTKQSERLNPYNAANLGTMVDALIELGRYPEAFSTLQRMVDLKPGVPSLTRVSYSYELRGDLEGARFALERALDVAQSPADKGFVYRYLGELALHAGQLDTAERQFKLGLQAAPSYVPLLAGIARVEVARGDGDSAVRDWQLVTTRLPEPAYLIEYADLLASLGRDAEAKAQYAVVDASAKLFRAQGANVDLELSLFDADHGRPASALSAAEAQIRLRKSTAVEDAYAWALHVSGRDREALTHAKAAQRLGAKNALFAYHRAVIEKSLGNASAAKTWFKRCLDINPYFSPLLAPLAKAELVDLQDGP